MELTRRDALAVLVGAGVLGGSAVASVSRDRPLGEARDIDVQSEAVVAALIGTAEVVYPSTVENTASFVETYAGPKLGARPEFATGATETLAALDAESQVFHDARYADLDATDREALLHRIGTDTAEPDPAGTIPERVRYYFVNEVLYALYASPTGGRLVGIENPQGHPGGTASYQRGPPE